MLIELNGLAYGKEYPVIVNTQTVRWIVQHDDDNSITRLVFDQEQSLYVRGSASEVAAKLAPKAPSSLLKRGR